MKSARGHYQLSYSQIKKMDGEVTIVDLKAVSKKLSDSNAHSNLQ